MTAQTTGDPAPAAVPRPLVSQAQAERLDRAFDGFKVLLTLHEMLDSPIQDQLECFGRQGSSFVQHAKFWMDPRSEDDSTKSTWLAASALQAEQALFQLVHQVHIAVLDGMHRSSEGISRLRPLLQEFNAAASEMLAAISDIMVSLSEAL